eukprot:5609811-Pyramimonas_sp.AAC.1
MTTMMTGKLRVITRSVMGGVISAGTRAPVLVAHDVHIRLIRGFQELHPEGNARRAIPPQDEDQPGEPEGQGLQRLVSYEDHGFARHYASAEDMQSWLGQGWTEHDIRHWYSLRKVTRDDRGKIVRTNR